MYIRTLLHRVVGRGGTKTEAATAALSNVSRARACVYVSVCEGCSTCERCLSAPAVQGARECVRMRVQLALRG